jgi:glycosyltransferase involved in cell wall biosynthesis
MTRVSVCLLSFNQAEFLRDSIESVLGQTFADWELIIVDNGSTDESPELLRCYLDQPKIRVILHDSNDAPTKRLNEAIAASTGEFVSVLYSDDFYLPDKLRLQVEAFDSLSHEYGVVYTPGERLDVDTGERWSDATLTAAGRVLDDLLTEHDAGRPINPISPLVRRACFERHAFFEDLFVEGELIYFRLAMTHKFHFLPQSTVVMRDHARNGGRAVKRNVETLLVFIDKLEREPDFPTASRPALKVMRTNLYRVATWLGVRAVNDPAWARQMLMMAVRLDWLQALHPKIVAGLGLSALPARHLRRLNQVISAIRPARGHTNYVEN